MVSSRSIAIFATLCGVLTTAAHAAAPPGPVSFRKQVAPILQRRCQGCHQPANRGGKLVVTSYATLKAGGDHGPGFVGGKADESVLVRYIAGKEPLMPKGGPPMPGAEVALIRRWIAEGARDDSVAVKDPIDAEHPPVYTAPPVIPALAFSPDGTLLAVAGYREVLLHRVEAAADRRPTTDDQRRETPDARRQTLDAKHSTPRAESREPRAESRPIARLVGASDRIESLAFSPDGKTLAAVGGAPSRFGEVQFWDVATRKLIRSVQPAYDVFYGASFSPDGKMLAFGGADNAVRIVTVPEGQQILKFDNHSDWIFGTTFSRDGKNIITASRDQAVKLVLIEGPAGSFVDDINHHYAGQFCVARHPTEDQALCAGADGIPRLYRIFREKARTMNNEDHNLIREFERQPGPVNAVAFNADGSRAAVGGVSSEVPIYEVKSGRRLVTLKGHEGPIYTIAFHPKADLVATAGFDGQVRLYDAKTGKPAKRFVPVPIATKAMTAKKPVTSTGG